jgi:hypothetical protein
MRTIPSDFLPVAGGLIISLPIDLNRKNPSGMSLILHFVHRFYQFFFVIFSLLLYEECINDRALAQAV